MPHTSDKFIPATKEEFKTWADGFWQEERNKKPLAFGLGVASVNNNEDILDVFYPLPNYNNNFGTAAVICSILNHDGTTASLTVTRKHLIRMLELFRPFLEDEESHPNIEVIIDMAEGCPKNRKLVATFISDPDKGPCSIEDVYLRLHLLSHRLVKPHEILLKNEEGRSIFGFLPNLAWTNMGPIDLQELALKKFRYRLEGQNLRVFAVDKIPHMTDYIVPNGVRIADTARVRLGAYIGEGTTIMQEGFVNFNAGTLGASMIEGRVSAGVVIGQGSDLGGGCSTMGTLSGGGKEVISIGQNCLIGAEAGCGISLGDFSAIAAGCYVTAGSKVIIRQKKHFQKALESITNSLPSGLILKDGAVVKAIHLSGISYSTFWVNSQTGQMECLMGQPNTERLNEMLHKN